MSTATVQPVSLNTDAVRAELGGISAAEANRLFAKRLVPATKVGTEFRVLPADLAAYIKAGAKNLRLPEYTPGAAWIDSQEADDLRRVAEAFATAIVDAGQEQVPADDVVKARFLAKPLQTSFDYELGVRGKVADVLGQAVPVSPFAKNDPKAGSRFSDWKSAWAVWAIRRSAKEIIQAMNRGTSPISVLYGEGPDEFAKIADAAYAAAAKRRVAVFHKDYSILDHKVFGPISVHRRAYWMLEASVILMPEAKPFYLGLSF